MTEPTEQQLKLVSALADAIADYHGEPHGDFACHYTTGESAPTKRRDTTNRAFRRTLNKLPPEFGTEARNDRELIWRND
jgi:hypothetical protein